MNVSTAILYVLGGLLSIVFICVTSINFILIYNYIAAKKKTSLIPLVGGLSGFGAALVIPSLSLRSLWWIPLIIDPGTAFMVLGAVVAWGKGAMTRR